MAGGYRDELDAALARVQQLEGEVADLRSQLLQTPAMQGRLAELQRRRSVAAEALRRAERSTRATLRIVLLLAGGAAVVFVTAIASLGPSGHPLNAAILSLALLAPLAAFVAWLGAVRHSARAAEVTAIEREIAAASSARDGARVAERVRVPSDAEEAGADSSKEGRPARLHGH